MGLVLREEFQVNAKGEQIRPASKLHLDPQNPISSITNGSQQFTVIADTDHSKGSIIETIAAEMPKIAKSGVKHLMLEYTNDAYNQDILKRVNSRPPQISERELLDKAEDFRSGSEKSGNTTGNAYAHLLIAAMKNGVTVHFTGDSLGREQATKMQILDQEKETYLKKHPKLERFSQALYEDGNFIDKLDWPQKEKDGLKERIETHRNKLGKNNEDWLKLNEERENIRMAPEAEEQRAERFLTLAQGEKSLVVFGRDHFRKDNDLNEAIDRQTRLEAFKSGSPLPEKTPVIEIWESKKERDLQTKEIGDSTTKSQAPHIQLFADSGEIEIPDSQKSKFRVDSPQAAPISKPREQSLSP